MVTQGTIPVSVLTWTIQFESFSAMGSFYKGYRLCDNAIDVPKPKTAVSLLYYYVCEPPGDDGIGCNGDGI